MKLRVLFAAKYYAIFHVTFSFRRGGVDISVDTRLKRMDHPELCDCFELDHLAKLIENGVGVFNNDVEQLRWLKVGYFSESVNRTKATVQPGVLKCV